MRPDEQLNGARLETLRALRNLTQQDLGTTLGLNQALVSKIEKGRTPLSLETALKVSEAFRLPLSFFTVAVDPRDLGPITYRKTSRATVADEKRVAALYTEASRLFREVSERSGYKQTTLPNATDLPSDPETAAAHIRTSTGLGPDEPILNLVRMLERQGVGVVTALDSDHAGTSLSQHAGASRPSTISDRQLVAVVKEQPGAVQRFTLGHELAHLVYDRSTTGASTSTRSVEELRANRFAGALLLPEQVVRERVSESLTLHGYLRIKADYGVSVGAIIRRARDLGVITSGRYRSLNIQLSTQGWRTQEPVHVQAERPILLRQATAKAFSRSPVAEASDACGVEIDLIQKWLGDDPTQSSTNAANVIPLRSRRND